MRTPKPPTGFIPVDSDEAKGIAWENRVNVARVNDKGEWIIDHVRMRTARDWATESFADHYHVQLPPLVEWEEVWGYYYCDDSNEFFMYRNKKHVGWFKAEDFDKAEMDTIVAALNKMEVGNG